MNIGDLRWKFMLPRNPGYERVRISTTIDHEIYSLESQFPEDYSLRQARDHMLRAISEHVRQEMVREWVK